MDEHADAMGEPGFCFPAPAVAVLDEHGRIVEWSAEAELLVGMTFAEVEGRPFDDLLIAPSARKSQPVGEARTEPASGELGAAGTGGTRAVLARSASGRDTDVFLWASPPISHGRRLVLFVPFGQALGWGHGFSFLNAVFGQEMVGMSFHDTDLTVVRTNITPDMFGGPPLTPGDRLDAVMPVDDAAAVEAVLRRVLKTGVPIFGYESQMRSRKPGERQWTLSLSVMRMENTRGEPAGLMVSVHDVTDQSRIRRHRDLLHRSAGRLGMSLDVTRTARVLTDIVTPELANIATVDLAQPILSGGEPPQVIGAAESDLVRIAVASTDGPWPAELLQIGGVYTVPPLSPQLRVLQKNRSVRLSRDEVTRALGERAALFVPPDAHTLAVTPLHARGRLLGTIAAWRTRQPGAFDDAETELLAEIGSRAALAIDNARRYAREHRTAMALQRRLLPWATTDTPAAETAAIYRPAHGGHAISGDWFDAIPLPSLRVALVVGDVFGHGLIASATMGRLRTAIQTFADLELEPAEVLTHIDDLVHRLAAEAPPATRDVVGATCLYAVYDPITRRCTLASAGQPPPVLIGPEGTPRLIDVNAGPPLGVGGVPYESVTAEIEPGSILALYTDGVLGLEPYADGDGMRRLQDEIAVQARTHMALDDIGRAVLGDAPGEPSRDDVTLLLSRMRELPSGNVRSWKFPADPNAVSEARAVTRHQLHEWNLGDIAFTAELVVSELVTNAIRYAGGGPVELRLIRDGTLICEVTDPSNTQPRLVRAGDTDEGGRGLFIVAQCTTRWGCRYGRRGKTIWTELPLVEDATDPRAA
ncbi:SpoIIE family protein phosphatase [Streptomyces sp. AK02-01A]|uniref:ATP-binding SpoIIE family protein phosphatase n=1 Tax=Streptomyces sp. AK02-01A TaxID=3028648 RepID=UPI0029BE4383|nr:SpoIIE family protein phosphatase [Streptomyces sp. AK02-01A]MDX3853934.1 SpoIIE family protein phosphatase [Streptomyces sp. AK02-01A]